MRKFTLPLGGRLAFSTGALTDRASPPIDRDACNNDSSSKPSPPPSPPSFWTHFGLGNPPHVESLSSAERGSRSPSDISTVFSQYSPYIPEWEDLETGCSCSPCSFSSLRDQLPSKQQFLCFGDKYEEKARNPASAKAINYEIRVSYIPGLLIWAGLFFIYCVVISIYWQTIGLQCAAPDPMFDAVPATAPDTTAVPIAWAQTTKFDLMDWINIVTSSCILFIILAGYSK